MQRLIHLIFIQVFLYLSSIALQNCSPEKEDVTSNALLFYAIGSGRGSGPFTLAPDFPCEGNISKATATEVYFKTEKERSGKGCRKYYKYVKDFASIGTMHQFLNEVQTSEYLKYYIGYQDLEISDGLSDDEVSSYEQSSNFIYVKKDYQGKSLYIEPGSFTYFIVEALSEHAEYEITFDGGDVGGYCFQSLIIDNNTPAHAFILTQGASVLGNVHGTNSPCYYEIRTNFAIPSLTVSITGTGVANLGISVFEEQNTSTVEYSIQNANVTKTLNNIPVSINSRRLIKVDGLNAGSCPAADPDGCPFTLSVQ